MINEKPFKQLTPLLSDIGNEISSDDEITVYDKSAQTTKRLSLENLSSFIGDANVILNIGNNINNGTEGSVLFVGESETLSQDNERFFYDNDSGTLKLIDKNYVPFSGSLNPDIMFSIGSNDNVQNNPGIITTSNHFIGSATDLKITASGASKTYRGQFTQFRIGGSYTGSPNIYGHHIILNNRLNTTATPNLYGLESSINIEGPFNEAIGMVSNAYKGTTVSGNKIIGIRAIGANGYTDIDEVIGGEFIVKTVSVGASIAIGRSIHSKYQTTLDHMIVEARGLALDSWDNSGYIKYSYGIYADTSIDVGDLERYFIYSLSTSPSLFSGDISVPDESYGVGWNGNFEVPTKNAIYDKIEALTIGTYTDEEAQDAVGNILFDGDTVSLQYNDFDDVITAEVIDNSLTFNYLQNISTNKLLGRYTSGAGDIETINIGTGLSLTGGTLSISSLNNGSVTKIHNGDYTMLITDHYVFYTDDFTHDNDFNLLSAASIEGKEIYIKAPGNINGFNLNIIPVGAETIDASGSFPLTTDNSYIRLMAVDGNWKIIDKGVPSF